MSRPMTIEEVRGGAVKACAVRSEFLFWYDGGMHTIARQPGETLAAFFARLSEQVQRGDRVEYHFVRGRCVRARIVRATP